MNEKEISWGRLLSDLQELKGIRQDLIAEEFKVTQQYISAMMNGARKPSKRLLPIISRWATEYNLNINDYAVDESDLNNDIKRICVKIGRHKNKTKILKSLNLIIDTL